MNVWPSGLGLLFLILHSIVCRKNVLTLYFSERFLGIILRESIQREEIKSAKMYGANEI